jgi:sulfate permease, SulP family
MTAVSVEDRTLQKVVLVTTFALTMLIPLQFAVLVGVGVSVILHVVRQSNQITIKRWLIGPEGDVIETDPPALLPAGEMDVLSRYAHALAAVDSKLVIVSANERVQEQLVVTGITDTIGAENVYAGDQRLGAAVQRAHADALAWIETQRR